MTLILWQCCINKQAAIIKYLLLNRCSHSVTQSGFIVWWWPRLHQYSMYQDRLVPCGPSNDIICWLFDPQLCNPPHCIISIEALFMSVSLLSLTSCLSVLKVGAAQAKHSIWKSRIRRSRIWQESRRLAWLQVAKLELLTPHPMLVLHFQLCLFIFSHKLFLITAAVS